MQYVLSEDGQIEIREFVDGVLKLQKLSLIDRCTREMVFQKFYMYITGMFLNVLVLKHR